MGHKMDDRLLITDAVETRLGDEADFNLGAGDRRYWKCAVLSDGSAMIQASGFTPGPEYQAAALDLVKLLNGAIGHDGAWIAAWTEWTPTVEDVLCGAGGHPERLVLLWIDHGGDPQFTVEIEDSLVDIVTAGPDHWIEQCEEAWGKWHHAMRVVLDPKPDQLYRAAQGERKPSLN